MFTVLLFGGLGDF